MLFLPLNLITTSYLLGAVWAISPALPALSTTIIFLAGIISLGIKFQEIFFAPNIPCSSQGVKTIKISLWDLFSSFKTLIVSIILAIPALSSPPKVVVPSVLKIPFSNIGVIFSQGSTTSKWAANVTPSPSKFPFILAIIVGEFPLYFLKPSSKYNFAPNFSNSLAKYLANSPSFLEWGIDFYHFY